MTHLPKTEQPDPPSHEDSTVELQTPEYFSSSPDKETSTKDSANTSELQDEPSIPHNNIDEPDSGETDALPNGNELATSNIGSDVETDAESDVFVDAEPNIVTDLEADTETIVDLTP